MNIQIWKAQRRLLLTDGERVLLTCRIGLGSQSQGPKCAQGDGRTPEGRYFICLIKENGKYGRSLGLSYPNPEDARRAFAENEIDLFTLNNVENACKERRRPPWGSPLGGEIYIHEGGSDRDWTAGCIALDEKDMDLLFPLREQIDTIEILP